MHVPFPSGLKGLRPAWRFSARGVYECLGVACTFYLLEPLCPLPCPLPGRLPLSQECSSSLAPTERVCLLTSFPTKQELHQWCQPFLSEEQTTGDHVTGHALYLPCELPLSDSGSGRGLMEHQRCSRWLAAGSRTHARLWSPSAGGGCAGCGRTIQAYAAYQLSEGFLCETLVVQ